MSEKKQKPAPEPSKSENEVLDEDKVRLKPFLGIRPGHYLACIYGAIVLLILFFILLYPGISNPGSVLVLKSEPYGAAVLVDGVYMGAAPCELFVPKGSRIIELSLPGFPPKTIEKEIEGRLFASALFPLKIEIKEKLEAPNPAQAFNMYAGEFAALTFRGEPTEANQIPLSLSEGAYRLGPGASDPAVRNSMEDALVAASRFAVTQASLRDLLRAKTLLDNQGLSPSPVTLLASASDALSFLDENPQAALWLASVLGGEAKSTLVNSPWYASSTPTDGDADAPAGGRSVLGGAIQVAQLSFRMINGGPLSGRNYPAGTVVGSFYICESVISTSAWERFIERNPYWGKENTETLKREGLVDNEYLNPITFSGAPSEGRSGISWYAAKVFCEDLNASLPPQLASWEVRLPTEAEWEYAAKAGALDYGKFWEWSEDPYVPLSFLSAPEAASDALYSPERSVRGGSWVNRPGSVGIETRGSLDPLSCSVFVSARPVIALKRN